MALLEGSVGDGHATDEERFELALLNIEPGHDGYRAVELLREIPQESPCYDFARIWLAYCYIDSLMVEEALRNALRICDELLGRPTSSEVRGGAYLLKAIALRELSSADGVIPNLKEAVHLSPTWILPRMELANAYSRVGDKRAAELELLAARQAATEPPAPAGLSATLFEELITARGGHGMRERIDMLLKRLSETKQ